MRKLIAVGLSIIVAIAIVGCSSKVNKNQITMVLDWTPNTNHTGFFVASALGYYEEEGIDIEIVQPPEDGATILVASGAAQFGISAQDALATAFVGANPLPITTVATIIQHNTSGLISLKEDAINTAKDLEEKTYATWDLPVEKAMIEYIMKGAEGDFSKLNLIPSTVTDVVTALNTDIDTVWVYYAWDGIATEVEGLDTNFLDFGKLMPELDFYTPVIIANNDYLNNNPEQAKAFLRATAKGFEYAIENPEAAAEILLKAAPELDADIVVASQIWLSDKYKAEVEQWGFIDEKRWNEFYHWLSINHLLEGEITENMGFTNAYLS